MPLPEAFTRNGELVQVKPGTPRMRGGRWSEAELHVSDGLSYQRTGLYYVYPSQSVNNARTACIINLALALPYTCVTVCRDGYGRL